MGQYYHPTIIDSEGSVSWVYTHGYGCGLKLMEHSYVGNNVVNAIYGQILNHPLGIAWIGDYSDEQYGDRYEFRLPREEFLSIFHDVYGENRQEHLFHPAPMQRKLTDAGWYLVNHTQEIFLDLDGYIQSNQWQETWKDVHTGETKRWDMCIDPLPLLTACGNDRGGGDYHSGHPDYDKVGSWAFDRIELTRNRPTHYTPVSYFFSEQQDNSAAI